MEVEYGGGEWSAAVGIRQAKRNAADSDGHANVRLQSVIYSITWTFHVSTENEPGTAVAVGSPPPSASPLSDGEVCHSRGACPPETVAGAGEIGVYATPPVLLMRFGEGK